MLVVKGATGWIIIDPMYSMETARAAMQLINKHLGSRPVSAVVYSHSHPDHYGGVKGVLLQGEQPPNHGLAHLIAPQLNGDDIVKWARENYKHLYE